MRFILAVIMIALSGCSQPAPSTNTTQTPKPNSNVGAVANGRSIYLTGKDLYGQRIAAQPPPLHQACAQCHGVNGAGGMHLPRGAVSADLRYGALVTGQKPPYTLPLIERAISKGIDNQGHTLSPIMPRWRMSARDLHDIAYFVSTRLR